jgi:hypothetical protein
MEQLTNKKNNTAQSKKTKQPENKIAQLLKKENVDQQAIDEATAAVGNDPEKIEEYLINNRGI